MDVLERFGSFRNHDGSEAKGVLAYARVSKEERDDVNVSIDAQLRRIKAKFEERLGYTILGVYVDEDVSAYDPRDEEKRVQFWEMVARAKTDPDVAIIAVDDENRFYRNRYKAPALKGKLMEHGVIVQTVSTDYDPTTSSGMWLEAISETRAHVSSLENAYNTMRAMREHVHKRDPMTGWCYKNGGLAPYGYRNVRVHLGTDRRGRDVYKQLWEIDDDQAPVLKRIMEMRATGHSTVEIRDALNADDIPSARGDSWATSSVVTLLREDMVWQATGMAIWNKHDRRTKGRKFKPVSEWEIVEDAHPAIIEKDLAEEVLAANHRFRRQHDRSRSRTRTSPYLLTGDNLYGDPMFVCLRCGSNMVGSRNGGRNRRKYVCSRIINRGKDTCAPLRLDVELLETFVLEQIRERFLTHDFILATIREANRRVRDEKAGPPPEDRRMSQLKEIDREIDQIKKAIRSGIDPVIWADDLQELHDKRKAIERKLKESPPAKPVTKEVPEDQVSVILGKMLESFGELGDPLARRQFVRSFVQGLELDPEKEMLYITMYPDPRDPDDPDRTLLTRVEESGHMFELVPPTGFEPVPPP